MGKTRVPSAQAKKGIRALKLHCTRRGLKTRPSQSMRTKSLNSKATVISLSSRVAALVAQGRIELPTPAFSGRARTMWRGSLGAAGFTALARAS